MRGNKIQKRRMEKSIHELPKWHWKFIASVLLFGNRSGKHGRWKQLVQVYTGTQRFKPRNTQSVSSSLAAATRRRGLGAAELRRQQWFLLPCAGSFHIVTHSRFCCGKGITHTPHAAQCVSIDCLSSSPPMGSTSHWL